MATTMTSRIEEAYRSDSSNGHKKKYSHSRSTSFGSYNVPKRTATTVTSYRPLKSQKVELTASCADEFKTTIALLAFCICFAAKMFARENNDWAVSNTFDVNNHSEIFPITTNILARNWKFFSNDEHFCSEPECRHFLEIYGNLSDTDKADNLKLLGTYSLSITRRQCETVELIWNQPGNENQSACLTKCVGPDVIKSNIMETSDILLVASMCADAFAIVFWCLTLLKYASLSAGRVVLVIVAPFSVIPAAITAFSLGLFAQSTDLIKDPSVCLGWPFYLVLAVAILTFLTTPIAPYLLYKISRIIRAHQKENTQTLEIDTGIICDEAIDPADLDGGMQDL